MAKPSDALHDIDRFVVQLKAQHARMRALAVRTLHDRDRADDALQIAYTKAYEARGSFRGDAAFATWLYRIVYRCCIDELRRLRPVQELDENLASGDAFEDSVGSKLHLHQALAELSPEHRAAVWLIDAEGYSYRDTAAILDVAEGTVASRVVRARAALQKALTADPKEVDS